MCVDSGTENTYFDNLPAVITLHKIPGPIHIDKTDSRKNTQTVESSHSGIKMRLRLGRGVRRHNLQPILDFEDFVFNRTDGTPAAIFKELGDSAKLYCSIEDDVTTRSANIPFLLCNDHIERIEGLQLSKIKLICSENIFAKSVSFEVRISNLISTQISSDKNIIEGEFRAARFYDQVITWGD